MIHEMTRKRLHVSTDGGAGPYIMVPFSQLADVRQVLDQRGIHHTVEEDVISLDGAPEIAVIDLGRAANADEIQAILDTVPNPRYCHGSKARAGAGIACSPIRLGPRLRLGYERSPGDSSTNRRFSGHRFSVATRSPAR